MFYTLARSLIKCFVVLGAIRVLAIADTEVASCRQGFFEQIEKRVALSKEGIFTSHIAPSWYDCNLLCLEQEKICVSFSYSCDVNENEPNCHLYRKEEDLKDLKDLEALDLGEDLMIHEAGKKETWEIYKLTQIESEICLKQQACQNGGLCLMDGCEPEGYKCLCNRLHYGKRCEHGINNFDLSFPADQDQNQSHLFVEDAIKSDLSQFTFTTWFKVNASLSKYRLFSYVPKDSSGGIRFVFTGGQLISRIESNNIRTSLQPVNDNVWHHFAVLWSDKGTFEMFIDGKQFAVRDYPPAIVPKGGDVYIGKHKNLTVADNGTGFIGELSRLNLWDHVLSGEEIEKMALNATNDVGNVLSWFRLPGYIRGKVSVIKPSTAVNTDTGSNFKVGFKFHPSGYIKYPAPSKQLDVLSVCLWIRTCLKTEYISYVKGATYFTFGVDSKKFLFAYVNGNEHSRNILISMNNSNFANGQWHFYCVIWNGVSGETKFFYEGELFEKIEKVVLKGVFSGNGDIMVGSEWSKHSNEPTVDGYSAKVAYLNVWSVKVPGFSIRALSAGGLNVNGDLIAWRNVYKWFDGDLELSRNTFLHFPGYAVSKRRTDWCNTNVTLSCNPLYARFGAGKNGAAMEWRCYCAKALLGSKFAYDLEKKSGVYSTKHADIVKIG